MYSKNFDLLAEMRPECEDLFLMLVLYESTLTLRMAKNAWNVHKIAWCLVSFSVSSDGTKGYFHKCQEMRAIAELKVPLGNIVKRGYIL